MLLLYDSVNYAYIVQKLEIEMGMLLKSPVPNASLS